MDIYEMTDETDHDYKMWRIDPLLSDDYQIYLTIGVLDFNNPKVLMKLEISNDPDSFQEKPEAENISFGFKDIAGRMKLLKHILHPEIYHQIKLLVEKVIFQYSA